MNALLPSQYQANQLLALHPYARGTAAMFLRLCARNLERHDGNRTYSAKCMHDMGTGKNIGFEAVDPFNRVYLLGDVLHVFKWGSVGEPRRVMLQHLFRFCRMYISYRL